MIDIDKTLEELNSSIGSINKLVKKGSSDSLETKYFLISLDMEDFIRSFVEHQKSKFMEKISRSKKLLIVDMFSGGGIFTFSLVKSLLQVCKDDNIEIKEIKILLNDKMYADTDPINSKTLEENFKVIIEKFKSISIVDIYKEDIIKIKISSINSYKSSLEDTDKYGKFTKILISNPTIIAPKKGNEHYREISFTSEDKFMNNKKINILRKKLMHYFDFFIYLTNQKNEYKIDGFGKQYIYRNDYDGLTIDDIEKTRYLEFSNEDEDYIDYTNDNFWKFSKSQDEKLNSIILFEKYSSPVSETYRYVYKKIYNATEKRSLHNKLKTIKDKLESINVDKLSNRYEKHKEKL